MLTRETLLIIRSLRGTPANIVLMMLALGRPTGRDELAHLTGYSKPAVGYALAQLELLGLARNAGRYNAWALTAYVYRFLAPAIQPPAQQGSSPRALTDGALPYAPQEETPEGGDTAGPPATPEVKTLHLDAGAGDSPNAVPGAFPEPDGPAAAPVPEVQKLHLEVKKLHLPSSSSCSSLTTERSETLQTSETTTTPDHPNCTSPPGCASAAVLDAEAEDAIALLCDTGCPDTNRAGKGARDAVRAALAGGWTGPEVLDAVRGWLDYAATPAGAGIQHPGFLTLARIRACTWPPEPPPKTAAEITRAFIDAAYERTVHR